MKYTAFIFSILVTLVLTISTLGHADQGRFPLGPNPQMTPGTLCSNPDGYRYPEHINYCNRNVASQLKNDIIKTYDQQFGYTIEQMNRQQFKIDHLIPLCMGGSNERENLWPQHESVYTITDPLEPLLCEKMAEGRIRQADAVSLIREAKGNLSLVPNIIRQVQAM